MKELIFHRPTYSFPSDHAAVLFAIGVSFWFSGYKKLSIGILVFSIIICFYRVAVGFHWPSDIIGGVFIGIISAWIIKLLDNKLDKIYSFLILIAKKLRLA